METEEFLGSLLYFQDGTVRLNYLDKIRNCLSRVENIDLNLSKSDIYQTVEGWNEYFVIKGTTLELTDDYKDDTERIKDRFFDRMDFEKKSRFWKLLREIDCIEG